MMKSIAKANGRKLDGMLYSTFRTIYTIQGSFSGKKKYIIKLQFKRRSKPKY